MPVDYDNLDDGYVADLLKRDASSSFVGYSASGLYTFLPKRATGSAPKPNTRFLRNILKETDSHNSALLAREQREARLKRSALAKRDEVAHEERQCGRQTDDRRRGEYHSHKRRRRSSDLDEEISDNRRHTRHSREDHDFSSQQHHYRHRNSPRDHDRSRDRSHRHRSSSRETSRENMDKDRSRKRRMDNDSEQYSRSAESGRRISRGSHQRRSRSPSARRHHESHRRDTRRRSNHQSQSPSAASHDESKDLRSHDNAPKHSSRSHRASSVNSDSDSDPLESIVGPAPPPREGRVRVRGRGVLNSSSLAMDSHFSADYNPADDVRPNSETDDDWDQALEALRDRQRWKQQGAERLRSAGFTESEVKKWEKGDQKDGSDVRWTKFGEDREWDRGKVIDASGNVELKPTWGT